MTIPEKFTVRNSSYALDGGTTCLTGTDERGEPHAVILGQSMFPKRNPPSRFLPGRLYFDGALVGVRSADEAALLSMLRSADLSLSPTISEKGGEHIQLSNNRLILGEDLKQMFARTPEENLRALVDQVITRVSSTDYVSFAEKAEE